MPNSLELKELIDHSSNPEAALLTSESDEQVREAVVSLPPPYRMVLVLHDMEELSATLVAQVLGLREGTVRVRLHRARLMLRRHLAKLAKGEAPYTPTIHAPVESARSVRCRHLFAALSDYMDGVIDGPTCDEIDRHIHDCEACQAFLSSLEEAVRRCRAYRPAIDPKRTDRIRQELRSKCEEAPSDLRNRRAMAGGS